MPVKRKVLRNMRKQYGKKKGTNIYYAWEKKHGIKKKKRVKKRRVF